MCKERGREGGEGEREEGEGGREGGRERGPSSAVMSELVDYTYHV